MPAFTQIAAGRVKITALADGSIRVPLAAFPDADPVRAAELAQANGVTDPPVTIPIYAFLVEARSGAYLIDAGSGSSMGPTLGHVIENMAAAGYAPADVKKILMTHLHIDHAGGLLRHEAAVFAKAELYLQDDEAAFWRSAASAPPTAAKKSLPAAIAALDAYRDRIRPFAAGERICDEIVAFPLPGHTPGHTGFLIEADGDRLLIWGDIVHASHLQVAMPVWRHEADIDPAKAAATRIAILNKAAAERLPIAGAHVAAPGFGSVVQRNGGFAFVPLSDRAP